MPLDPSIILGAAPAAGAVQPISAVEAYKNLLALQNAKQQQQANALNLESGQLGLQEKRQDLSDVQAIRDLYAKARQNGTDVSDQDLLAAAPTKAPTIIKSRLEAGKLAGEIKDKQASLAATTKDYLGAFAYGIQQSNYDPAVIEHSLQQATQDGFGQQAQQLAALYQKNPQAFHQQVDNAVLSSPKQQQLANERATAKARTDEATVAGQRETREAGKQQFEQTRETANDRFSQAARTAEIRQGGQRLAIEQNRYRDEKQMTAPEGSAGLSGEDFLKTLSPRVAGQVKAIAEGRQQPPSSRSSKAGQNLLGLVSQYDPTFDANRFTLRKDVESGKAADNVRSINTSIQHFGEFADAVGALKNNDVKQLNRIANQLGYETGNGALPAAELARVLVRGEIAKAATGGHVTVEEQKALDKSLDTAQSPQSILQVAKTAAHLLGGKLGAMKDQYNSVMKGHGGDFQVLTPTSKTTLKRLGIDPTTIEREASGAAGSGPADYVFHPQTGLQKVP